MSDPALHRDLLSFRLSLFTGKGGVGKSTLVAALAIEAARRGLRPLIVELGHRASMQGVLRTGPIEYEPREVVPGVHALNLDVGSALSDYVTERVRVRGLARAIVENPALDRFFHAAPGVAEVVTLAKLESLVRESRGDRPSWHPVFVDLDATGHALMLLELPRVLDGLVGRGPLRRVISSATGLLTDESRTRLHLVMLPGELVVQETIELYERLSTEHAVPLGTVFANQIPDAPLDPGLVAALGELEQRASRLDDRDLADDIALARRAVDHRASAQAQLRRLASAIALPMVELPRLSTGDLGLEGLARLGRRALQALEAAP